MTTLRKHSTLSPAGFCGPNVIRPVKFHLMAMPVVSYLERSTSRLGDWTVTTASLVVVYKRLSEHSQCTGIVFFWASTPIVN